MQTTDRSAHERAIRTLIVDDEPPARSLLRRMLAEHADVEIVGECGTGEQAIATIRELEPDLVFLDIQMPENDGFDVVQAISGEFVPEIVFVTAFDRYAVRAFDVAAVDYLLKPFDHERLARAVDRVRTSMAHDEKDGREDRLLTVLDQVRSRGTYLERFVVRQSGRLYFVRVEDVEWIESEGNYLLLHIGEATHVIRETMQSLETRIDPRRFLRIHRSIIVNLDFIKEMRIYSNTEQLAILKSGQRLALSRRYWEKLSQALRDHL